MGPCASPSFLRHFQYRFVVPEVWTHKNRPPLATAGAHLVNDLQGALNPKSDGMLLVKDLRGALNPKSDGTLLVKDLRSALNPKSDGTLLVKGLRGALNPASAGAHLVKDDAQVLRPQQRQQRHDGVQHLQQPQPLSRVPRRGSRALGLYAFKP